VATCAAAASGGDGVHATLDGVLVAFHERGLDRIMTDDWPLCATSWPLMTMPRRGFHDALVDENAARSASPAKNDVRHMDWPPPYAWLTVRIAHRTHRSP
jgi:hypothetical protein